jgi:DNA-binding response OmpR family regulator
MIIIVDERKSVVEAFASLFAREGVAALEIDPSDLQGWITGAPKADLAAVEAFLVGQCPDRATMCRLIASSSRSVVVAVSEARSLEDTLALFACGADDVVRMPMHVKEILARINAVSRRTVVSDSAKFGNIQVFFDGRDPEIGNETFQLPRRERRILEYLANNAERRVTKSQIFNAVYGLFNEDIGETVIESHISKLRKRLRERLGYDPIDCKRFLGYRLTHLGGVEDLVFDPPHTSHTQDIPGLMVLET